MKRLAALGVLVVAAIVLLVVGTGAGDSSQPYVVRAEFRNAFTVTPGEQVKIAGVAVGTIRGLDVTPRQTAVIVMDITEPGFKDFRSDASCTIRPQSLIGERFVECTPTQPRAVGQKPAPALRTVSIDGETQHFLPVSNTRKPVDIDLVANTLRLPYRERLSIILGELGAGTAARGSDLRTIIRDGDPALAETDRVLDILKSQNAVLSKLAVDGDTVLKPLADNGTSVSDFIDKAGTVATATAERRTDLERTLQRLPAALRQLQPTMQRLDAFSTQLTPLVGDLNAAAPQITRVAQQLGPFATQATPALQRLGDASEVGRTALLASRPVIKQLRTFAQGSTTVSADLRQLTESIRSTGGIDQLLNFVFYSTTSSNGYDQFGHYIRSNLLLNLCAAYATERDPVCSANYGDTDDGVPRASFRSVLDAATSKDATSLQQTAAVLRGVSAKTLLAGDAAGAERSAAAAASARTASNDSSTKGAKGAASSDGSASSGGGAIKLPSQVLPGAPAPSTTPSAAPQTAATAGTPVAPVAPSAAPTTTQTAAQAVVAAITGTTAQAPAATTATAASPTTSTSAAPAGADSPDVTGALLDFLLGGGGR